jgi:hypothetical protein
MPPIERDQLAWVFTMSLQKGGGGARSIQPGHQSKISGVRGRYDSQDTDNRGFVLSHVG